MKTSSILIALLLGAMACETARVPTAPGPDAVQVSAVLNPALSDQTVLVERVHSGRVDVDTVPFDPADPVATGRGIPMSGARVVVEGPDKDSVVLVEDLTPRGIGTGVYRFSNSAVPGGTSAPTLALTPGGRYVLRVTTPDGTVITGETIIPDAQPVPLPAATIDTFDRSTGRLALSWRRIPSEGEYALFVESPRAPFILIAPDTSAVLDGSLRQPWEGLDFVFTPGFTQAITVLAMDRNFYDFYRPERNSNAASRSHLSGGYGVFGSIVPILVKTVAVTLPPANPPAGTWRLVPSDTMTTAPRLLQLYVSDQQGSGVALSGNYSTAAAQLRGVLGQQRGDSISLALLGGWSALDTLGRLDGVMRDSTLDLVNARTGSRARYVYGR